MRKLICKLLGKKYNNLWQGRARNDDIWCDCCHQYRPYLAFSLSGGTESFHGVTYYTCMICKNKLGRTDLG